MLISTTNRVLCAGAKFGFIPTEVDLKNMDQMKFVLEHDWSPVVFTNTSRDSEYFQECSMIFGDVDNTDENTCTIEQFKDLFKDTTYLLSTSKSHQKEKITGSKNKTVHPPADRYHVFFPLEKPIYDINELSMYLRGLGAKYAFFDKAVKSPAQLIFASVGGTFFINKGKCIDLETLKSYNHTPELTTPTYTYTPPPVSYAKEDDILASDENRRIMMDALRNSARAGCFDSYADWIAVGLALKAGGFTAEDYASISHDDAREEAIAKFETFNPTSVTEGTLFHYAQMSTDIYFQSEEDKQLIAEGDAIFKTWQQNAQEERMQLLASRTQDAKAGPPPANMMPPSGLIHDIATYILETSRRPLPGLAIAAATAFVGVLAGRKFQSPTGLGTNLYFVGLAESGSGKEHARKCIKNIAHAAGCGILMGGETIASGAGLRSSLVEHPARLFQLDEFGLMLEGLNSKSAGSYQKDIITTFMRLYSAYGSIDYGTEYSDKKMRKRDDIESPCCVLYGTSTHQTFYNALTGGDGASGQIARMLVINESMRRPDRQDGHAKPIPEELIQKVRALFDWKNTSEGPLAQFFPKIVPMKASVQEAFDLLDDSMTDKMVTSESRSVYARVNENAIKLALTFAVARDFDNPIIDEYAFAWGRDLALWCANTLMEQFNDYVSDTDHGKIIKKMLLHIKRAGSKGISGRDLLVKMQEIRQRDRDEIIKTLLDIGHVFEQPQGRTKVFIHSDFYIKPIDNQKES